MMMMMMMKMMMMMMMMMKMMVMTMTIKNDVYKSPLNQSMTVFYKFLFFFDNVK